MLDCTRKVILSVLFYHFFKSDLTQYLLRLIHNFILAITRTADHALAQGCAKTPNIFAAKGVSEVIPSSGLYLPKATCSVMSSGSCNSTHCLGLNRSIIREDTGKVIKTNHWKRHEDHIVLPFSNLIHKEQIIPVLFK